MDASAIVWPPRTLWRAGLPLRSSAWTSRTTSDRPCVVRTLKTPGDIGPLGSQTVWSLHLGLPANADAPRCILLSNGYRIEFPRRIPPLSVDCLLTSPGVLIGQSAGGVAPFLFSAEAEVQKADGAEWIDSGDQTIVLASITREGFTRFCLSFGEPDHAVAMTTARSHLSQDVSTVFGKECAQRARIFGDYVVRDDIAPLVAHGFESLVSHLRSPSGVFPFRWSVASAEQEGLFDINQVHALVSAWRYADPDVAKDILKSALACQRSDGSIPARCRADGAAVVYPARPLFARSAAMIWNETRDTAFVDHVLPKLKRHLEWALKHYDPAGTGSPCWQSADEAFIPATFDRNLASADIGTFLVCETEAFLDLCGTSPMHAANQTVLAAYRDLLVSKLESTLWNPKTRSFPDRYMGGEAIERITLSALTPLMWDNLPARYEEALLKQLTSPRQFGGKKGIPLWIEWEGDADPAPVHADHQILLLEALARRGAREETKILAQSVSAELSDQFAANGFIRDSLGAKTASRSSQSLGAKSSEACASALTAVLVGVTAERVSEGAFGGRLKWLTRHGQAVVTGAAAALIIVVLSVTLAFMSKKTLPRQSIEALAGLARQYYVEGNYDQAISICNNLLPGTDNSRMIELIMANALLQKGDLPAAENHYRNILRSDPKSHVALMNLGLTLFHQGRMDESRDLYQRVVNLCGDQQPALKRHAETAIELIAEHSGS